MTEVRQNGVATDEIEAGTGMSMVTGCAFR
jgi:hypothetical protein